MPTIPMGNFGQTVVQPGRGQRVFAEQAGEITGRATAELGQTMQQIGLQEMQQQTRMGVEAYEREAQTTAARVRITKQNDLDEAADTLAADIKAGRVDKDKADEEWNTRRASVLDGAFDGLDERYRGKVQAELEGIGQLKGRTVRDAVTLRDQGDTRANIMTLGEEYQRKAVKDRAGAVAEFSALIDAMGPAAGFGPDEVAKQKQGFRENTAFTQATELVGGARDIAGVRKARDTLNGEGFADLDPQRRAQIEATLDGREVNFLQRQEIAAQTAARKREAHLREAGASFETAQRLIDSGIPLDAAEYDRLAAKMVGTPYLDGLKSLQSRAKDVGGFAAQAIPEQRKALRDLYAMRTTQGNSEALSKRIDQAEKVLSASEADSKSLGIEAYARRNPGVILEPIDTTSPEGFIRSIGSRLSVAREASVWSGKPESPVMNDEAETLANTINALPVQQRATALGTLGRSIGPQAAAGLAAQIDKKDKALALALQFGTSATTEGRTTAEIILRGQQAMKDKTVKPDTIAVDGWKAQIAQEVEGAYSNQKQADDVKEAAFLIMSGLQAEGTGNVRQAVGLAARGRIVEHNGKRIPLPAGVTQDELDAKLRGLTPQNFTAQAPGGEVRIGGQAVPLDAFVQSLPDSQLVHAGYGRYNVLVGERFVTNAKGDRITITAK